MRSTRTNDITPIRTTDTTRTSTRALGRSRSLRTLLLVGVTQALVLIAPTMGHAAALTPGVSWAPHLDRKIVPTRATPHGPQLATWYGPGLYGNRTACGNTLTPQSWGIAHRTLPCGTLVTVRHQGRRVSVRVIDRGPFSGATVDLTERTKRFLKFTSGSVRMTEVRRFRMLPKGAR